MTDEQRQLFARGTVELGNIVASTMVFGQFISSNPPQMARWCALVDDVRTSVARNQDFLAPVQALLEAMTTKTSNKVA
jgi:hypothetical protein